MIFNSYVFIFLFLPLTVVLYYAVGRAVSASGAQKLVLICASVFFYGYWNIIYVPLLLLSIGVNFYIARSIVSVRSDGKDQFGKILLVVGVVLNLGLLGYFKYTDFFIESINVFFNENFLLQHIVLPLAISFFTFQQIAYLVDSHRNIVCDCSILDYLLFVTFFPQLIAGPIVHHTEMMPQFFDEFKRRIDWRNMSIGLFMFSIGLFKKVMIADTMSLYVNAGYSDVHKLNLLSSWAVTLAYSFQIYFDFSGYMDMAHGCARMFNITLPWNFNSPYKSLSIQDFWRRWHITLSRFLRDYLYIPLGGSRGSLVKIIRNVLVTFILGGIWHGAGWTFAVWGALHGVGLAAQRIWQLLGVSMPKIVAWTLTFLFVHLAWVFFRAPEIGDAWYVIKTLFGFNAIVLPPVFEPLFSLASSEIAFFNPLKGVASMTILAELAVCFGIVLLPHNSNRLGELFAPSRLRLAFCSMLFVVSFLNLNQVTEFIYFQF